MKHYLLPLILSFGLGTLEASPETLYKSLNPQSVSQHLAYYRVYPDTDYGKEALEHAWTLLGGKERQGLAADPLIMDSGSLFAIVDLVQGKREDCCSELSAEAIAVVQEIARDLPNRQLPGYHARSEAEVLALEAEDVDLARGLLLSQLADEEDPIKEIQEYEAMLDLMALQIRAGLEKDAGPEEKIHAINHFIFHVLQFRFPPHSLYAKDIDTYTFLPSVMDSREGVCLGVTAMYLCLAQRLDLPLEIITPPGHIYIRHRDGDKEINIETTARGIHMPSEVYLGVNTRSLEQRSIKEVIGMTHFNHASVYWQQGRYEDALAAYRKSQPYSPDHTLLLELMGSCAIVNGEVEEGTALLKKVRERLPDHAVSRSSTPADFLDGKVDAEGLKAIFMPVDETRESILEKQVALKALMERCSQFRTGQFHLAVTWLQLHRPGEAIEALEAYHRMDPEDPTAEYYLSMLYAQRQDFVHAWKHLRQAEKLVAARDHDPKALESLRRSLAFLCPDQPE